MKKTFFTELAYSFGIVLLAIGTAFMERANFGMSMVVAPAYILHLKISETFNFFTFGMAEYVLQAIFIGILALVQRRFNRFYLFSFVTAVIYGFVLDRAISVVALIPYSTTSFLMLYYIVGMLLCSIGVSLLFQTYIPPEAYELFVKEMSEKLNISISRFKTIYDCTSCMVGIILSFAFFGLWHFEGVKLGTIVCALLNGWLIGRVTYLLERIFEFRDGLHLRKHFEK